MIKLINILREGKQVGDIYHYTSINGDAIINILKSGKLRPSPARMEKKGYISFSRDRSLNYTLGSSKTQVRITIDGDKFLSSLPNQAPEEVVPGFTADTLGIDVYTKDKIGAPTIVSGAFKPPGKVVSSKSKLSCNSGSI
jgi:hypothetical protein